MELAFILFVIADLILGYVLLRTCEWYVKRALRSEESVVLTVRLTPDEARAVILELDSFEGINGDQTSLRSAQVKLIDAFRRLE